MRKRVMAVALAVPVLGGALAAGQGGTAPTVEQGQDPPRWVAFSADVRLVFQDGTAHVGRFFRASDGSMREELAGPDGYRGIALHNIAQARYYEYLENLGPSRDGWTARPMDLPAHGWRPPRLSLASLTPLAAAYEGFEAYEESFPDGGRTVLVPALDFFAVVRVMGRQTRTYSHIVLGEPSPDLFVPPPGAQVRWVSSPGGIVQRPRPRR